MRSIRTRLFLILLVTTGFVWLFATAWIYVSTRAEVEQVLDARLAEAARMVSSLITSQQIDTNSSAAVPPAIATLHRSYDRQLSCQIWALDGSLVGRSNGAPEQPLSSITDGFSEALVEGEVWRVYAVQNTSLGIRVLVGDSMRVRDRLVADVIRGVALPAMLILPVLAALIWLSVAKGLAPLNAVAQSLQTRTAADLSPLSDEDRPSEIRPVIHALNGLFSRVEGVRARERDFTAFAGHELRTPIAGLKTQAQIALSSKDEVVRGNALHQIVLSVDRTSRLIRQLTDLTNAESSHHGEDQHVSDLADAMRLLVDDLRHHHPKAPSIVLDPAFKGVSLHVSASLFMLSAKNLLENAALHSPPDKPVCCSLHRDEGGLAIAFEDAGPGIPGDELSRVSDRFFRGRNKTAMGSGLGLAIASLAMKRMGAELILKNGAVGLRAAMRFPRPLS